MSASKYGYLAKLRALRDMRRTTNAHNVSRHLEVSYECARSALRRLEAAGLVIGARTGTDRWRPEVVYSLTSAGMTALDRGVELSLNVACSATETTRKPRGEAATGESPRLDWRGLHEALGMGDARVPQKARKVRFALDSEPVAWRYGA